MKAARPDTIAIADFGKTRSKVAVLTAAGERLSGVEINSAALAANADGSVNVETLGRWCEEALADLYWEYPFAHLLPVTHGATAVALRQNKQWLPVRDYEAPIDTEITQSYERLRPAFSETGSPSLPSGLNLGRQLYALQTTDPAFAQADTLLSYPQYWTWRWCGALGTDISSLGCHTDLWQPRRAEWSSLARAQHWAEKFPPLIGAGQIAAPARASLLQHSNIKQAIDVHWGIHDSNAALAAFLDSAEPFTLLSSGTWLVAFGVGSAANELDPARDTLWNIDVHGRPVASARCMLGRERECIAGKNIPAADLQMLNAILQTDALALPAFAPGGPFPDGTGHLIGAPLHNDSERAALASLYIALMADAMLDLIGARGDIIVEGPLAADSAALTALAALRPAQPVYATRINCVAHGAVRLAFGSQRVATPATQKFSADVHLISALAAKRQQWRRAAQMS